MSPDFLKRPISGFFVTAQRLLAEAELDRGVAVLVGRELVDDHAGARVHRGDRSAVAVAVNTEVIPSFLPSNTSAIRHDDLPFESESGSWPKERVT